MTSRIRGFTLIEILVAVFIVGIVMSIAVLSLSLAGDDREAQREARRLISLIQVAQDDAFLQGREFGLEFLLGGYRFVEYDPQINEWADVQFDESLKLWTLPEGYELELYLEDQRVLLDEEPVQISYDESPSQVREEYAPHLLIFSSGDATPFEVHIVRTIDPVRNEEIRVGLQGDLLGNLEIMRGDEFGG